MNDHNDLYQVYEKEANFKALPYDVAIEQQAGLIADGWEHVATISAPSFIEYIYNNYPLEI